MIRRWRERDGGGRSVVYGPLLFQVTRSKYGGVSFYIGSKNKGRAISLLIQMHNG